MWEVPKKTERLESKKKKKERNFIVPPWGNVWVTANRTALSGTVPVDNKMRRQCIYTYVHTDKRIPTYTHIHISACIYAHRYPRTYPHLHTHIHQAHLRCLSDYDV